MKFGHCIFLFKKPKHAGCTEYSFCFRASRANKLFCLKQTKERTIRNGQGTESIGKIIEKLYFQNEEESLRKCTARKHARMA